MVHDAFMFPQRGDNLGSDPNGIEFVAFLPDGEGKVVKKMVDLNARAELFARVAA